MPVGQHPPRVSVDLGKGFGEVWPDNAGAIDQGQRGVEDPLGRVGWRAGEPLRREVCHLVAHDHRDCLRAGRCRGWLTAGRRLVAGPRSGTAGREAEREQDHPQANKRCVHSAPPTLPAYAFHLAAKDIFAGAGIAARHGEAHA